MLAGTKKVVIAGEPKLLRFDMNAVTYLEGELGKTLGQFLGDLSSGVDLGIRGARAMLYAGLRWQERTMSPDKAGDLIEKHLSQGGDLGEVLSVCGQALGENTFVKDLVKKAAEELTRDQDEDEPAAEEESAEGNEDGDGDE